eukprot:1137444-Pleurochrysis_carterae.AAC.2
MARVTHRALPPLTVRELGDMPVFAATGATATAALFVVATKKGEAQASSRSSALSGNVRASRTAARTAEGRGMCLEDGASQGSESLNMRSPEAWSRKRRGETHATHRSMTTGATGARKCEATMTGRHIALHARERSDGESGQDGQDSA